MAPVTPAPRARPHIRARCPAAVVTVLAAAFLLAGAAWAFFVAPGVGRASAATASLTAPSITGTTAGAGTMTIDWSSIAPPGPSSVRYYVTRDGGAPAGDCPDSAHPSAVTSCSDAGLAAGTHDYTVTAVWRSWTATSATSSPAVPFGTLDHFSVSTGASAIAGGPMSVTVTAQDVSGNTITSYAGTVHFTSTDGQAVLPADYTFGTGDNGSHTFSSAVTLKTAGSQSLTVDDTAQTSASGSATVSVSPAAASTLSLAAATNTAVAGAADNLTITALDAYGNTATSYSGSKSLTFAGAHPIGAYNPSVTSVTGSPIAFGAATAINFSSGVASVSGSSNGVMKLYKAESVNLTVTDGAISNGVGLALTVGPASASSLSLSASSTGPTAGAADNLTITAFDAYGNTATSYTGSKSLTFGGAHAVGAYNPTVSDSSGAAVSFGAATAINFSSGVASVSGSSNGVMKLYKAESVNLTVTDGTLSSGAGVGIVVSPVATATSLSLSAVTASPNAGAADDLTITALDTYGNTATSYAGSKSLTFGGAHAIGANNPTVSNSSGTAVSLGAATAVDFSNGVASVSGSSNGVMKLYKAESVNLTVTDGTIGNGTGLAVSVGAATAGSLSLSAASTSPTAGAADNLTITAFDAYGNTATGYTGSKTLTFGGAHAVGSYDPTVSDSSGAAVSFGAATAVDFSNGVASVSGSSNGVMKLYRAESVNITVSDGAISNGTGLAVIVSPLSTASSLSLSATTAAPTAGSADNLTITALDTYGNTAPSYAGSKSLTFGGAHAIGAHTPTVSNSSGTAVNLGSATAVTFTSGVASVSGSRNGVMKLYKVESVNITVTDGTLTNGTGLPVSVSAGAASVLSVTPAGVSGAKSTTPNLGPLTVSEADAYGNATTTAETVNLSSSSGTASFGTSQFGSTVTSVSIPSGSSSASFYYGDNTTGTPTITAAATGLTSGTRSVTITAAPAGLEVTPGSASSTSGTPALASNCTTIGTSDACTITGTKSGGNVSFTVRFATSGGAATTYSSSQSSTLTAATVTNSTMTPGTLPIAAGASTTTSKFTATHGGSSNGSVTVKYGPYTLTVTVGS